MIRNVIVISDLHCGCQFGLCPDKGITLDGGGRYVPSDNQKKVWQWWKLFWAEWVPKVTRGEPFALIVNGDTTDGRHHNSTTQISQNLSDQKNIAEEVLFPIVEQTDTLFMTRGTSSHVGESGENEEMLAENLKAVPDSAGNNARNELFCLVGGETGCLIHVAHHIGTTGSTHYESSAVMKEMSESYAEAGRWNNRAPDIIVRSHRHRNIEVRIPTANGYGMGIVTPGWQLKTPFVYRIAGGRLTTPQFGGILIRQGDEEHYTRSRVWNITRPEAEIL